MNFFKLKNLNNTTGASLKNFKIQLFPLSLSLSLSVSCTKNPIK